MTENRPNPYSLYGISPAPFIPETLDKNDFLRPATGLVVFQWGQSLLSAGMDMVMWYHIPGVTLGYSQMSLVMPFRGSVVALTWNTDTAKTAGTCTFSVRRNGTAMGISETFLTGTTYGYGSYAKGTYGFDAGDRLAAYLVTDANYLPANNELVVQLYVYLDQSKNL